MFSYMCPPIERLVKLTQEEGSHRLQPWPRQGPRQGRVVRPRPRRELSGQKCRSAHEYLDEGLCRRHGGRQLGAHAVGQAHEPRSAHCVVGYPCLRIGHEPYFDFVASHHSAETVQAARHPLVEEDATLLRLDARFGLGSGLREDVLVKCEETSF